MCGTWRWRACLAVACCTALGCRARAAGRRATGGRRRHAWRRQGGRSFLSAAARAGDRCWAQHVPEAMLGASRVELSPAVPACLDCIHFCAAGALLGHGQPWERGPPGSKRPEKQCELEVDIVRVANCSMSKLCVCWAARLIAAHQSGGTTAIVTASLFPGGTPSAYCWTRGRRWWLAARSGARVTAWSSLCWT